MTSSDTEPLMMNSYRMEPLSRHNDERALLLHLPTLAPAP